MNGNVTKKLKTESDLNGINVLFIRDGINSKRLTVLEKSAQNIGFVLNQSFCESTDYIITDLETEEKVIESIGFDLTDFKAVIVNTKWFTDSVQLKRLLDLNRNYCLKTKKVVSNQCRDESKNANYICQRKTPLSHQNHKLTEALELLAFEAELHNSLFDSVRYLAFKKASAALKCLSFTVTNIDEVSHLRDIGKHSKKIIEEILDEGLSHEVAKIKDSIWFKTMRLFTNVYGIGPKAAQKWFDLGFRTLNDVIEAKSVLKSQSMRVLHGMAFYDDLNQPMSISEAKRVMSIIRKAIELKFGSDSQQIETHLTGGFSRGKQFGHDVDVLICHKDEGREAGLLSAIYQQLKEMNLIIFGNFHKSDASDSEVKIKTNSLDNFDKMFALFKLPIDESKYVLTTNPHFDKDSTKALLDFAESERKTEWKLCRVDLIVCPNSQLCFAQIGWTGNEMFCRSLKEYAKKEMNFRLNNHCLHDLSTGADLSARTEQEVFELLKLPFIEHHLRNP